MHDAFIALYRRWDTLDEPGPYLHTTVLNGCRGIHRQRSRQRRLLPRFVEHGDPASVDEYLDDLLAELPFHQRAAVVLRFYGGLTTEEIARELGCAAGSVGPWINRTREDAEGPAMTDVEQLLTDHLRRRAAVPPPATTSKASSRAPDLGSLVDLDDHRPRRPTMRTIVVVAAAAAAVIAIAVVTILGRVDGVDPSDKPTVSTSVSPPRAAAPRSLLPSRPRVC